MSEFKLYQNLAKITLGIDACLEKKLELPALVLLYSGIDVAGWLSSPKPYSEKSSFMSWVNSYMVPAKPLGCTAEDLYAGRCGILHTLTPYARPAKGVHPRLILYAWGTGSAERAQGLIVLRGETDRYVAVHVNDLHEAWRLGLLRFTEELDKNPTRKALVCAKAKKFFSTMGPEIIDAALSALERKTQTR